MGLYNLLFGINSIAPILKEILNLDTENGYDTGRFRDIYLEGDIITLYTRNGGGNRYYYQEVFDKLSKHPNYIRDYDDDFDNTYAYIEFTIPEEYKDDIKCFEQFQGDNSKVSDKFQNLIKKMEDTK